MGVYNQVCLFLDVVNCNWISDAGHDEIAVSSENNVLNFLQHQSNCMWVAREISVFRKQRIFFNGYMGRKPKKYGSYREHVYHFSTVNSP